jgi:hypothetical protein
MFMAFKMINIYWFVSNEMVRQHIDKYTNVRHSMQVMTGLVVCKNLTQIENVSQNIVHAEIKCPHDHLAYLFSYQSYQYTNHNVCLYYWLYHSSKVRYLSKTFRPTMKNMIPGFTCITFKGFTAPIDIFTTGTTRPTG